MIADSLICLHLQKVEAGTNRLTTRSFAIPPQFMSTNSLSATGGVISPITRPNCHPVPRLQQSPLIQMLNQLLHAKHLHTGMVLAVLTIAVNAG